MQNQSVSRLGSATSVPQPATLAMRLEQANNLFANQIRRIESALGRVEGNPTPIEGVSEKTAATAPLALSVETAEMLSKRMCDLADRIDRIA